MSVWDWMTAPYNQPTTNGDIVLGMIMALLTGVFISLALSLTFRKQ